MGTKPCLDKYSKDRRDKLRVRGLCLNGKKHGHVVSGVLCDNCKERRRLSIGSVGVSHREYAKRYAKDRRDELRSLGLCLNGKSHGKATDGGLCSKCRKQHTLSH